MVDLGCAYGIASIAALEAGARHVIACDIEQEHLDALKNNVMQELNALQNNLTLKRGCFPDEIDFERNSIGAVLCSYSLPYLTKDELDRGLEKIFKWLKPGGKLFIVSYTVFIEKLSNDKFKAEYQKRLDLGIKWPGYFEDFKKFISSNDHNLVDNALPGRLHYFDIPELIRELVSVGFGIEKAEYLDGKSNGAVTESILDGRELLGIIAKKP